MGGKFSCKRKSGNNKDPYAVAVMRRDTIVGYDSRKISAACSLFLGRNGIIHCTITGTRRFSTDLPQGGLEVPCELKFKGEPNDIATCDCQKHLNVETTEIQQPNEEPDVISVEDVAIKNTHLMNHSTNWLSLI